LEIAMTRWTSDNLAAYFDHTLLKADATKDEIVHLCQEAHHLGVKTVCIQPIWLTTAVQTLRNSKVVPITVVGFPLGATPTQLKVYETEAAIKLGAREIDMVISTGAWKSGQHEAVRSDIRDVKTACGNIPLKVILETALLTAEDITLITKWCAEDHVAFVKTSTGFSSRGASLEDVRLMKAAIDSVPGSTTKIKASGGIRTLGDVLALIEAGASRIGASATAQILAELQGATSRSYSETTY